MSDKIVWQGKHLQVVMRGTYECIQRRHITGIVGIIAVTDEGKLILVEQFRPPVQARVIELPAGLVGDGAGDKNESIETAARRELLEETGYQAREVIPVAYGAASAGLSNELIHLVMARGLTKVGDGGGDEHEDITVHEVPLAGLVEWLRERQHQGVIIDLKVYLATLATGNSGAGDLHRSPRFGEA
jgi:ADP-ribose pyrophosphatase